MLHLAKSVVTIGVFLTVTLAHAQPLRTQVPVPTRLVQLYLDYEQRLIDAINRRDTPEIDRLVADDFELREAARPGAPIPRAAWIAHMLNGPRVSPSIEQMAVQTTAIFNREF